MLNINTYFSRVFIINLNRRPERWTQAVAECDKYGITNYERFEAVDGKNDDGTPHGNKGCTQSHRRLWQKIAASDGERYLILEDDFACFICDGRGSHLASDQWQRAVPTLAQFDEAFDGVTRAAGDGWDILMYGGGYANEPVERINPNIVKVSAFKTTSSYAVTRAFAKTMSEQTEAEGARLNPTDPADSYIGAADDVLSSFMPNNNCWCVQPRIFIQRPNVSDLNGQDSNYYFSMSSMVHERMV